MFLFGALAWLGPGQTALPVVTEGMTAGGFRASLGISEKLENCKEARRGPVTRGNIHSPSVAEECEGRGDRLQGSPFGVNVWAGVEVGVREEKGGEFHYPKLPGVN